MACSWTSGAHQPVADRSRPIAEGGSPAAVPAWYRNSPAGHGAPWTQVVRRESATRGGCSVPTPASVILGDKPANPLLELVDIAAAVVRAADGVLVLVDNTFGDNRSRKNPARSGATLVPHFGESFRTGHATLAA